MFEISRVFHVTHVVDDLDAALDWYANVLGALPLGPPLAGPTGSRICLVLVGDLVFLPMSPGSDDRTTLRVRHRFGQHLHSLAWFVDDPADLIAVLQSRGLALRDEYGRPLDGIDHEIWTPPRQAPCLLEFFRSPAETGATGTGLPTDPRFGPGWSPEAWRQHPLGIEQTACLTVVTGDEKTATAFFTDALRGDIINTVDETDWDAHSTLIQVGDHTVIEVAQPLDTTSRPGADLAANGEIFHAVTLQVADLDAAADFLLSKGLRLERPTSHALAIDPEDTFGLMLRFTDRPVLEW
jgi:catechol 2,3-dioxygenase-like lactoylglutathione lyase family enzyme